MYKKFKDDEIWKELAYFFKNPPTAEEEAEYKRQQDAWVQDRLDYIFDNDLLKGGNKKNVVENWDDKGKIYNSDINGYRLGDTTDILTDTGNKLKAFGQNVSNIIKESNPDSAMYKQKADAIAGIASAPFGLGKTATTAISSKIAPYLGRKIGKTVAESLGSGVVGGGVYGTAKGLTVDDKNLSQSLGQGLGYAATGGVLGAGTGMALGKLGQYVAGKGLQNHKPFNQMGKDELKQYNKQGKQYYKDYLLGTKVNKKDYGEIYFNSDNAGKNKVHNFEIYPQLKDQIKTSNIDFSTNNKLEEDRYYDHLKNTYNGKNVEHQIEVIKDKGKRYKMTKQIDPAEQAVTSTADQQNLSNNIIRYGDTNFNPSSMQNNTQQPLPFMDWLKKKRWGR